MKNLKYIFILFLSICFVYFIYVNIPYVYYTQKSPFKNAELKSVYLRKRVFWEFSLGSSDPLSSEYQLFYDGNKIYSFIGCEEKDFYCRYVINVNWYQDSVKIIYEVVYEGSRIDSMTINYKTKKH